MEKEWQEFGLEGFKKLCKRNNIVYEVTHNYIKYKTETGAWLIELNTKGESLSLWHLNRFYNIKLNDYHLQRTYQKSDKVLIKIFNYTFNHDKRSLSDVGKPSPYSIRMNQLFELIEVHK